MGEVHQLRLPFPRRKHTPKAGRPKAVGRFDSREELEERVLFLYTETDLSIAAIARNVRVSDSTVHSILREARKG